MTIKWILEKQQPYCCDNNKFIISLKSICRQLFFILAFLINLSLAIIVTELIYQGNVFDTLAPSSGGTMQMQ